MNFNTAKYGTCTKKQTLEPSSYFQFYVLVFMEVGMTSPKSSGFQSMWTFQVSTDKFLVPIEEMKIDIPIFLTTGYDMSNYHHAWLQGFHAHILLVGCFCLWSLREPFSRSRRSEAAIGGPDVMRLCSFFGGDPILSSEIFMILTWKTSTIFVILFIHVHVSFSISPPVSYCF